MVEIVAASKTITGTIVEIGAHISSTSSPTSSRACRAPLVLVLSTTAEFYNSRLELRCSSVLLQSQWHLRTFARNAFYRETCSLSRSSDARSIAITSEWAYVYKLIVILIVTFSVAQAVNLSFPAISGRRQTNIQIVAGYVHRRMQSVKWKKDKITPWDSKLDL